MQYTAEVLGLKRKIISLGNFSSRLQANLLEYMPGKPFSRDNYRSLQMPSTCKKGDNPLRDVFGIEATPLEAVVPHYLAHKATRERYMEIRRQSHRD